MSIDEAVFKQLVAFTQTKVPMIAYSGLKIVSIGDEEGVVMLPFTPENQNHLKSVYFGSFAVGADAAGGLLALYHILKDKKNISLVFKDFKAEFLRRAEGDTYFTCKDGAAINALIKKVEETGERQNLPVTVIATVPSESEKPVAKFVLTLSLK
jgi:acyl-coenzyme A thioesterase PaaI-like protein